jgi:hypothetical protein
MQVKPTGSYQEAARTNHASPPWPRRASQISGPGPGIFLGLYRFKTHRMVFELGIHEIGYAAW